MRVALESPETKKFPPSDMTELITKENKEFAVSEAIDLVRHMLRLDPSERPTARQVLDHPFLRAK
jgi:serine/threonine protein kinase